MTFTLLPASGHENKGFRTFTDGHLYLLRLYQARFSEHYPKDNSNHSVLFWKCDSPPSFADLYGWYCKMIEALRVLDPDTAYDARTEVYIWFGEPVSGLGYGSNITGKVTLEVIGEGPVQTHEIEALLQRHESHGHGVRIGCKNAFELALSGRGRGSKVEFLLSDTLNVVCHKIGLSELPKVLLADLIESTSPLASWYRETDEWAADDTRCAEECFVPSPLSRPDLEAALADIEKAWFEQ